MANQPFTLYNPDIPRQTNELVSAQELRQQLVNFYKLYKPQNALNGQIDTYLHYARSKGVLALRTTLKYKYKCTLEDADPSEVGWLRIYKKLEEYYKKHAGGKPIDLQRIYNFAKTRGLLALNIELENKYGESLSDFMASRLINWKLNWKSVLTQHHTEAITYELKRFYNFVESLKKPGHQKQPLAQLVDWAVKHSRSEVNEKLLHRYDFCLDDVRVVKGTTNEERKINLKTQLVEFYRKHDPSKLGDDVNNLSNLTLTSEALKSRQSLDASDTKLARAMQEIERDAEYGIIHLEELENMLIAKYGVGLEDNSTKELRKRLVKFYQVVNAGKNEEAIEKVVDYAKKKGLDALNEKLVLTYGKGIVIDDLS